MESVTSWTDVPMQQSIRAIHEGYSTRDLRGIHSRGYQRSPLRPQTKVCLPKPKCRGYSRISDSLGRFTYEP